MRKTAVEEKRAGAEDKRAMTKLIAEENKTMMMDPSTMDTFTRDWCDLTRFDMLQRRRQATYCGGAPANGGGVSPASGGGGGNGVDAYGCHIGAGGVDGGDAYGGHRGVPTGGGHSGDASDIVLISMLDLPSFCASWILLVA
jgi:hypothetical protein